MKKMIFAVCAVCVMAMCAASSAVAQDWSWGTPVIITPGSGQYTEIKFYPRFDQISGRVDAASPFESLVLGFPVSSTSTFTDLGITENGVDSVFAPPVGMKYVIDNDTIALETNSVYDALDAQPLIPATAGEFASIAAGPDGKLYVLYDADNGSQYLLEGTPLDPWDIVKVRFSPRSLNLGSNGQWVNCQISGFPEGYTPAHVDPDGVCIVAVNDKFLVQGSEPICSKDSGGPYNNKNPKKLILKFDRKDLADFITANSGPEPATTAAITVSGLTLDGLVQFYGEDVIKVKAAKVKKDKK